MSIKDITVNNVKCVSLVDSIINLIYRFMYYDKNKLKFLQFLSSYKFLYLNILCFLDCGDD